MPILKSLFFIFFLLSNLKILAQNVGINTTTPQSVLEIKASNPLAPANTDGLLIPRVDTFPAVNPSALQNGMMVYLTTVAGTSLPGIYCWNNTTANWDKLQTTTANNWELTGNSGTNPATNFIGTTDDVDLVFKRQNIVAGKITNSNTSLGWISMNNNTSGIFNTAIGMNALRSNTTGLHNTAVGGHALRQNLTGTGNIALGYESLLNNLSGINNIAIGYQSLSINTEGGQNYALGYRALGALQSGYNNIGIGSFADVANPNGSNQLSIGNVIYGKFMHSPGGTIGIGVTDPTEKLEVAGKTKTTNLQVTNGAGAGKLLTSDATGNAIWQDPTPQSDDWGRSGNAGTVAGTNFIGTTDAVDVVFKRDNIQGGRIGFTNTALGNEALLLNTLANDNTAIGVSTLKSNTTGTHNTAIGSYALINNTGGRFNTSVGVSSMITNTTGQNNTAVGVNSLLSNTDGQSNVAAGFGSLQNNTLGHVNTAVGNNALFFNTTGSENVALGHYALGNKTIGNGNIAIGSNSGYNILSGLNNIAIGVLTNMPNANGSHQLNIGNQIFGTGLTGTSLAPAGNIGIGTISPSNTLEIKSTTANTSGLTFTNLTSTSPTSTGTAIGVDATGAVVTIADGSLNNWSKTGNAGTTAGTNFLGTTDDIDLVFKRNNITAGIITTDNLSFGHDALTSNTTGTGNTAFGSFSLKTNTLGFNNTAIGTGTLQDNTSSTAIRNTAIGAYAMRGNNTGSDNTAVGSSALALITAGVGNTAVGQGALFLSQGGNENTVIGRESMTNNVSGYQNTVSGAWVLRNNTTGALNTVSGYTALNNNVTGGGNTVFGAEALFSNGSGALNTAIGFRAGRSNSSSGSNNITIGAHAEVPSGTASNQISIANLIYATGATSAANAGNVGIGISAPTAKLEVVGTTKTTSLQTTNLQMTAGAVNNYVLRSDGAGNGSWVSSTTLPITETDPKIGGQTTYQVPRWTGSQLTNGTITDLDNGYIGIGTTNPQAKLHISGINYATSPNDQRGYFSNNTGTSIVQNVSPSGSILLRSDGWVWSNGGGFVATSDARIKNIKGITDNEKDLAALSKIEITDYKYKDEISNGEGLQKKVIAQQLKPVYPIAVNQSSGVIPTVFEVAKSSKAVVDKTEITTNKPHGFSTGDEVKLILDKSGEKIFKVAVSNQNTFSVPEIINETVFVYGKKVNDLLNVDYDALTTLNISATQQLIKETEVLKAENLKLKTTLEARIASLLTRLEAIEQGGKNITHQK